MMGSMIQRYIFGRCLIALGLVLGIFSITIMLVDVVEQLRTVGSDIDLSPLTAVQLSLMKLPGLLLETLSFAILVAAMIAYNQLSKSSELSVIRATGQSAWQFLAPVMVMAAGLGIFAMAVLNPLGAHLSERFETTRANLLQEGGQVAERARSDVWLRQGTDDSQIVIHAASVDSTGQVFTDVRFLEEGRVYEGARPTSRFRFIRRIDAKTATISGGFWQLTDLVENTPGNPPQRLDNLAIETDLDPNTLLSRFTSPNTIGFWSLPQFIAQTGRAGLDTSRFSMRWFGLTALPVLYTAMALIGAIVCLRLSRLGGTSRLIAVGAGAAVALFFVTQIASSFGSSGAIPAVIAAWSPALCALFISLTVLAYQEDG
ncbi:MAG: LptF/LptG family permease [Hyphomonadaceae bacterium]|nr:LptF/LptG family permease [Hyphomonadaceae bacterium]